MKHIVSWTLSDVPQEARQLARAGALREGVSVGDWLARRIFAEGETSKPSPSTNGNSSYPDSDYLDGNQPHGRDHDAVASAWRGLGSRDDQETSRIRLPERDATAREQDWTFQLLSERMDRVERQRDTSGLREAVRGLHQGLSRVAEQAAGITTECTGQLTTLARSIEGLAKNVASLRGESQQTIQALEEKLAELQERLGQDKQPVADILHLDDRLKRAEERIESSSSDVGLARLELRIKAAEERIQEGFAGPIAAMQGNFDLVSTRLKHAEEREEMNGQVQETLHDLKARLDAAERKNGALLAELNANIDKAAKSIEAIENNQIQGIPLGPVPSFSDPLPMPAGSYAADADESRYESNGPVHRHINPAPSSTSDFVAQARRAAQTAVNATVDSDRPDKPKVRNPRRKVSKTVSALVGIAALIVLVLAIGLSTTRNTGRTAELALPNLPNRTASLQSANAVKAPAKSPSSLSVAPVQPPSVLANTASNTITPPPALPPPQVTEATGKPAVTHVEGSVASTDPADGRLLEAEAKAGNAIAQYRLGTRYENGRGVVADAPQAVHWYSEAAKRGNRKAMHNLGTAYASGKGTQKDLIAAARWFKSAAELGVTDSQFNLAMLYEHGLGVQFSITEAYKWYAIAAEDGGDPESKTRIAALSSQIPPAERDAANRAAKVFKPQPMNVAANEEPR